MILKQKKSNYTIYPFKMAKNYDSPMLISYLPSQRLLPKG